ncbi:hypothetical protein EX30DRAFT_340562 [Ascodesmis nigricans]|uniref:Uncharacterized protein n=1 Tax=Ascodesmis nigricans TaxID=341454 RepID=A0A4V3SIX0_9PEZI|nr:hypothetical protein EX30DRAFT_340562 [Ascodesmis nigricans]
MNASFRSKFPPTPPEIPTFHHPPPVSDMFRSTNIYIDTIADGNLEIPICTNAGFGLGMGLDRSISLSIHNLG